MGYIGSKYEMQRKIENIKKDVNKLQIYSWDEILSFVPDSDDLYEELTNIFDRMEEKLLEVEESL